VTRDEIDSLVLFPTPKGTMNTEMFRVYLETQGAHMRQRLAQLDIDYGTKISEYNYPIFVVADAFSGHGVDRQTLEMTDKECKRIAEKCVVLAAHHVFASLPRINIDPLT
jgi:isocitrate lyase